METEKFKEEIRQAAS